MERPIGCQKIHWKDDLNVCGKKVRLFSHLSLFAEKPDGEHP